jgi:hypothetical protein
MFQKEDQRVYDENPVYYVYYLVNPETDVPFYVGKGQGNRCKQHLTVNPKKSRNRRLTGHIKNLREKGLEPKIVKIKENMKEIDAYELEEEKIIEYGRIGFDEGGILLNIFISIRPERRCGEYNGFYGKQHTKETKKKIGDANRGRTHKEETKQKMSEKRKGVPKTEEHKRKIGEKSRGRSPSQETRQKLKEQSLKEENLRKNIESKQKEYIVTTPDGEEIEVLNLSDYCKENGLDRSKMYSVAAGERNHHKNFKCRKKYPDDKK